MNHDLNTGAYAVAVVEDSIADNGVRLTTLQLTYPRYIHAEVMTHRVFSRNASSSRAIPVAKLVDRSLANMVEPLYYGQNQAGMQAMEVGLSGAELAAARRIWRRMAEVCAEGAKDLAKLGLHKQWANRPTEWFGTISVVVTATEWDNFFELRDHTAAQPEIRFLAGMMRQALDDSTPTLRKRDREDQAAWHLPYCTPVDRIILPLVDLRRISAARCARVSYLNHDQSLPNVDKDVQLYMDLVGSRPLHASPVEHQAYPLPLETQWSKNFRGWRQHREIVEIEIAEREAAAV
ncbi:FAD-dependent thymidylate synthase [Cupriavidus necator]